MRRVQVQVSIVLFLCLLFYSYDAFSKVDPFSKIIVTSKKAVCLPVKEQKDIYSFTYKEDVKIVFADNSTISSDSLNIVFDAKKNTKLKKIIFSHNVTLVNANNIVTAQSARVDMLKRTCLLWGNVKIEHSKKHQKDVPIELASERALVNFDTKKVTFLGSVEHPVSMVISFKEYSKNKKVRKQKNKKVRKQKSKKIRK